MKISLDLLCLRMNLRRLFGMSCLVLWRRKFSVPNQKKGKKLEQSTSMSQYSFQSSKEFSDKRSLGLMPWTDVFNKIHDNHGWYIINLTSVSIWVVLYICTGAKVKASLFEIKARNPNYAWKAWRGRKISKRLKIKHNIVFEKCLKEDWRVSNQSS